jgi:hypothetical protein
MTRFELLLKTFATHTEQIKAVLDNQQTIVDTLKEAREKKWVGLTDDEIEHLRNDQPWWMVRDIEAKLKEKNGG